MQKLFNLILILIFMALIVLFSYKTLRTSNFLSANLGSESETSPAAAKVLSDEELNSKIKDYILGHPEVLVESIENMQKKKLEESSKQAENYLKNNRSSIENDGFPPVIGNKDGDVTIVMIYDYNCRYCKQANMFLNELLKQDGNVKVVLRPLSILGGTSGYAAKVALAISRVSSEKFVDIHNQIMQLQPITEESVKEIIEKSGIDPKMVANEINSISVKQSVDKNLEIAKNIGINGAPSYVINGLFFYGLLDTEKLKTVISEVRKNLPKPNESSQAEVRPENNDGNGCNAEEENSPAAE